MVEWVFSKRVLHIGLHVAIHSLCHIVFYFLSFGFFWLCDGCALVWCVTSFYRFLHLWHHPPIGTCSKYHDAHKQCEHISSSKVQK